MIDKKNQNPRGFDPDLTITWHNMKLDDVPTKLKTHTEGLSTKEVTNFHFGVCLNKYMQYAIGPAVAEEFTKLYLRMKDAGQKRALQAQTA